MRQTIETNPLYISFMTLFFFFIIKDFVGSKNENLRLISTAEHAIIYKLDRARIRAVILTIIIMILFLCSFVCFFVLFVSQSGINKSHIITVAIVVPILALLALLAYWYFCHPRDQSSKTG